MFLSQTDYVHGAGSASLYGRRATLFRFKILFHLHVFITPLALIKFRLLEASPEHKIIVRNVFLLNF